MKKDYLFTLFALLLSQLFWAQTTESFETAGTSSTTFTSNSQVFNITSTSTDPFKIVSSGGWGWSGTAADNKYIDNSAGPVGTGNGSSLTIKSAGATAFTVKSLYIYITTTPVSGVLPSPCSATYVGKKAGLAVYTITKSSGYGNPSNTAVNNGFTLINFATEGGTDYSNSAIDELVITASGNGDYIALDAFRWQLPPANTTPTDIALSATSINENVAANSTVGALTSTDANVGDTFTYSLVAGTGSTDNASFAISGSNLQIVSSPNFETKSSYAIRVRTTDSGGLTFEKQYTITVNNINEVPTDIALSATAVNENVVANSVVGTLSTTDPDSANTFTYSLVAGTGSGDNASFAISGNNLQIVSSPNFETKSSYALRVRTSDQGGMSFEKQFTVTINNVNETPTDITLSATAVDENVAANSTVGTLSSTDPDASNTFTYTLVSGTGDTDNASFNISGANLRITNSPDFEAKSTYSIRVSTTDQGSLTFEKQFTITINNINDVIPVITSITTDSGDSSTDYITKDNKPTVYGTAEPGTLIVLMVNGSSSALVGATVTTNGSGVFTFPFPVAFGTLADAVANFGVTSSSGGTTLLSANRPVTIDTAAGMSFTTPITGDNIIDNIEAINLTLSGTSTSVEEGRGVTITISDGANPNVVATTTIDAGGVWTKSGINLSSLNDGALTITVNVTDLAGNTGIGNENGVTLNKATLSTTDFNASKNTVVIYPNPVSSTLTVVGSENNVIETIEIITTNGQVVVTVKNSNTIDVSNLVSGVFFVKSRATSSGAKTPLP